VHKFFARANPPPPPRLSERKRARTAIAAHPADAAPLQAMSQKPAFHRYFCVVAKFSFAIVLAKNFPLARFAYHRGDAAIASGAQHLHTILSGVPVIFFLL